MYVDGSFAGIVADFDGAFHHLMLTAGPHRIEIRAPGYQPIVFDVAIQPATRPNIEERCNAERRYCARATPLGL